VKVLLSFHSYRDVDLDELAAAFPTRPQVFADSGAFSAYTVGAEVTVDGYVAWLRRWQHLLTTYVVLDVIRDPDATRANQERMEDAGLHPIPVFHVGTPWDELERLCEAYPYIALGGMVGAGSARQVLRWCIDAFRIARQTGTVFHGFGQTTLQVLRDLPWYSVDSSSWGAGHRYGTLSLWDHRMGGRWVRLDVGDHDAVFRNAQLIRDHGGNPTVLATKGCALAEGKPNDQYRAERAMVIGVNVVAWVRLEAWLRQRHGEVRHPQLAGTGPQLYLADARNRGVATTSPDLALAEQTVGPMLYLAEGSGAHLVTAANALHDRQPKEQP